MLKSFIMFMSSVVYLLLVMIYFMCFYEFMK